MLCTVLKIIGILIAVFSFSVFAISVGVEIALRAYFENYRKDRQLEEK